MNLQWTHISNVKPGVHRANDLGRLVRPGLDSPDGPRVRKRFEELAGDAASAILRPAEVSAKDLEDPERAIADGASKFMALVEKSLTLIERTCRDVLPPERWNERGD